MPRTKEPLFILAKNENFYREPQPILDRVIYVVGNPINPMSGYEEGLDQLGLPGVTYDAIQVGTANLPRVTDPNNPLSDEFQSTNSLSVFYLGFNVDKPPGNNASRQRYCTTKYARLSKPRSERL